MTRAGFESPSSSRPVANISFALNYYFHQYHVLGYHLVNILIHAATAILLYLFVKTTLSIPSLSSRTEHHGWIAFFAALIWLVHPIQTQSVTYIVQRMNSMAAMFYVLSLLLYARARLAGEKKKKWGLFSGCILSGILALGSKEMTATLPFFILIYEWYFFQDLSRRWLKRHLFPFVGIMIAFILVAYMYVGANPLENILKTYEGRDFTLPKRVLTEFRVVIFYISLLVFPLPSRLNLDHNFSLSHSLIDPVTTLLSIGAIAGLIGLAVYMAKRRRLFSFCILWFLGNLVIESSVIGLEMIFEHRTYLPSMLVSLMAVTFVYRHIKPKWFGVGVLCAVVMVFSVWTHERNSIWGDNLTLWRDCVEKSPKKARPRNNLGKALTSQRKLKEAMRHFSEALRIRPDYPEAHNNLAAALAKQGRIKEAISHYAEALRIKPDSAEAHYNLGNALSNQGRLKEAVSHYLEALRIKPDCPEAHNNLGTALVNQGRLKEAMNHFSRALRIKPEYSEAHRNLGLVYLKQSKLEKAVSHFSEALGIKPDDEETHYRLGIALMRQKRIEEAISHYYEALRIKSGFSEAHNNLGNALSDQGRLKEAVSHYIEALRIKPDYPEAHNNLGVALANQGRLKEAMNHFSRALRIKPEYSEAYYNLGNALARQGRLKEAISHYNEALRIKPNDADVRRNLERALRLMGKSAGASNREE
jgi:tetratricopeptide (TPR) repeat protein